MFQFKIQELYLPFVFTQLGTSIVRLLLKSSLKKTQNIYILNKMHKPIKNIYICKLQKYISN